MPSRSIICIRIVTLTAWADSYIVWCLLCAFACFLFQAFILGGSRSLSVCSLYFAVFVHIFSSSNYSITVPLWLSLSFICNFSFSYLVYRLLVFLPSLVLSVLPFLIAVCVTFLSFFVFRLVFVSYSGTSYSGSSVCCCFCCRYHFSTSTPCLLDYPHIGRLDLCHRSAGILDSWQQPRLGLEAVDAVQALYLLFVDLRPGMTAAFGLTSVKPLPKSSSISDKLFTCSEDLGFWRQVQCTPSFRYIRPCPVLLNVPSLKI